MELHGKADHRGWQSRTRKPDNRGRIQSTAGHVESGGKQGGPPSKPKYYLMTDSEAVPWGKGEKNPGRGVKQYLKPCVYKQIKHVKVRYRTFCRTVRRVYLCSKVKVLSTEAEGKPSLNRAKSYMDMTRNRVTYPWTGWSGSEISWRSEPTAVEKVGDELWVAEKF